MHLWLIRTHLFCRCKSSDHFVYSGDTCNVKTEKLKLESKYIIAITCGSAGLLIIICIIMCIACRRCRRKEKHDNDHEM